jgi:hypothetical protein
MLYQRINRYSGFDASNTRNRKDVVQLSHMANPNLVDVFPMCCPRYALSIPLEMR